MFCNVINTSYVELWLTKYSRVDTKKSDRGRSFERHEKSCFFFFFKYCLIRMHAAFLPLAWIVKEDSNKGESPVKWGQDKIYRKFRVWSCAWSTNHSSIDHRTSIEKRVLFQNSLEGSASLPHIFLRIVFNGLLHYVHIRAKKGTKFGGESRKSTEKWWMNEIVKKKASLSYIFSYITIW